MNRRSRCLFQFVFDQPVLRKVPVQHALERKFQELTKSTPESPDIKMRRFELKNGLDLSG